MRTAEQVLAIIHDRGERGLPLEDVYRQLYNPDLYLRAYGKIAKNTGSMTRGATPETADGMSQEKSAGIIALLRQEKYRWTPVRRVYIEKKHSTKKRPLGVPTWSDKLLQEVIRMVLEAYYEPQFSDHSHGFRPARGCHTALGAIERGWRGTTWFIEGDIKGCFDNIDHTVLLSTIAERIHDNRFLLLLRGLLDRGLALQPHAERHAARRRRIAHPREHLPRPSGPVHHRDDRPPAHSRDPQKGISAIQHEQGQGR